MNKIHYFGSYLPNYPRHRIIQAGLREMGISVSETQDRSFLPLRWWHIGTAIRATPRNTPIVIGEASNFLTPIFLYACLLNKPIIFDVFVSIRDHIEDSKEGYQLKFFAPIFEIIDRINNWASSIVLLDTMQSRKFFIEELGLNPEKAFVTYVGAETELFYPRIRKDHKADKFRVLFYGSYHLLHGIDVILAAAEIVQKARSDIQFQLIGDGPTRPSMELFANQLNLRNVEFITNYIPYSKLPEVIANADLCLGIFADRPKTRRVIPTKVYQCASMGVPVITADTPAIREGFSENEMELVPIGDPHTLANAILYLADNQEHRLAIGEAGMKAIHSRYNPKTIALQFLKAYQNVES